MAVNKWHVLDDYLASVGHGKDAGASVLPVVKVDKCGEDGCHPCSGLTQSMPWLIGLQLEVLVVKLVSVDGLAASACSHPCQCDQFQASL